jgi:hypothetical protein
MRLKVIVDVGLCGAGVLTVLVSDARGPYVDLLATLTFPVRNLGCAFYRLWTC